MLSVCDVQDVVEEYGGELVVFEGLYNLVAGNRHACATYIQSRMGERLQRSPRTLWKLPKEDDGMRAYRQLVLGW